jgi:N-acetyl-gamma-glutamyl-phosphate reductase
MTQNHKHLKEMQKVAGLARVPVFNPVVADYYNGMVVTIPLFPHLFAKEMKSSQIRLLYERKYAGSKLIRVLPYGYEPGYFASNALAGKDTMEILVSGTDERLTVMSRFDNLGKGASGAAIQCMNLVLGQEETKGLSVG